MKDTVLAESTALCVIFVYCNIYLHTLIYFINSLFIIVIMVVHLLRHLFVRNNQIPQIK